jgi:hypothetical protein
MHKFELFSVIIVIIILFYKVVNCYLQKNTYSLNISTNNPAYYDNFKSLYKKIQIRKN